MAEDLGYYQRRLQQEQEAAAAAACDHTRRIHEELAALYASMLNALASVANDRA